MSPETGLIRSVLDPVWASAIKTGLAPDPGEVSRSMAGAIGLSGNVTWGALLSAYQLYPSFFFCYELGIVPWVSFTRPGMDQLGMIEAIRDFDRVAVKSGHKVSKSNTAAGISLWNFSCFTGSRTVMTSSSFNQVRKILWRELKARYYAARHPIGGQLYEDPNSGLVHQDGREIFGFSTDSPERAAGISGDRLVFLLDEASGIMEAVFEAIEGNSAGGAKIAMWSNPTQLSGRFFEAFTLKRESWKLLHIDSRYTPNCAARKRIVPGLATREWADKMRKEYGEGSPFFAVRVRGDFPSETATTIISLQLVAEAITRYDDVPFRGRLSCGLDTARYGDDHTVFQAVRGKKAERPVVNKSKMDGPACAEFALNQIQRVRRGEEEVRMFIDAVGENGTSTIDYMRRSTRTRSMKVHVIPVDPRGKARNEKLYANIKTETLFGLRKWLQAGGALPDHERLQAELASAQYDFDARGRYIAGDKKKERKRLGYSPDIRDALVLAVMGETRSHRLVFKSADRRPSYELSYGGESLENFAGESLWRKR